MVGSKDKLVKVFYHVQQECFSSAQKLTGKYVRDKCFTQEGKISWASSSLEQGEKDGTLGCY